MGGYGSGRRGNKKDTAEDYLCLDIAAFRRRGQWKVLSGVITWSRGEVRTASVGCAVRDDGIDLQWQTHGGESVRQHVPITSVGVNYGSRYYFCCPACERRVAKLFAGTKFYCRHCYNLTYESCQKSHDRFHARLGLTDKQFRNFLKVSQYSRELKGKKRVGVRMLRRLDKYIEKSNVRF
jgi:hypothetical protein